MTGVSTCFGAVLCKLVMLYNSGGVRMNCIALLSFSDFIRSFLSPFDGTLPVYNNVLYLLRRTVSDMVSSV